MKSGIILCRLPASRIMSASFLVVGVLTAGWVNATDFEKGPVK
jgi:hypothetical protein